MTITREQIIAWARECGAYWEHGDFNTPSAVRFDDKDLHRFAALIEQAVRADEREQCAKVCEEIMEYQEYLDCEAEQCAAAIRARQGAKND